MSFSLIENTHKFLNLEYEPCKKVSTIKRDFNEVVDLGMKIAPLFTNIKNVLLLFIHAYTTIYHLEIMNSKFGWRLFVFHN